MTNTINNTRNSSQYLKNNLNIKCKKMIGAVCTPKATLFYWNFLYGQVNAAFGLESGCIEK